MTKQVSFIGLDCGATHTKITVWKLGLKVYEKNDWPGMNMDLLEDGSAVEKFKKRLFNELRQFEDYYWVIALSGVDSVKESIEAVSWWKRFLTGNGIKFKDLKIIGDIDLVMWSGSDVGQGIGLIAGTGSNCMGKDRDGKTFKVGGMSHLMSDEGSGFSLGWSCLRLITKMSDGRVPKTKLLPDILNFYNQKSVVDLKNYLLTTQNLKAEIASSAPILLEAVSLGDQEASEIIDREINELVLMVATINRLMSPTNIYPVFVAGSLFANEYFLNKFKENLQLSYPGQEIKTVSPIDGVVNFVNATFKY